MAFTLPLILFSSLIKKNCRCLKPYRNSHSPAQLTQQFFNWHITFIVLSSDSSTPTSPLSDIIKTCGKTISSKNCEKCSQTTTCIRHRRSDASAQMRPLLYYYTSTTINKNYNNRHEGGHNNSSTIHKLWQKWPLILLLYDCKSLMVCTAQSFRNPFLQFVAMSQVLTTWTSSAARFDSEDRFAQP